MATETKRPRRTPKQVVLSLVEQENYADAAVYISARVKACRAEMQRYIDMCPEQGKALLTDLLKD